jgi:hypothetical protein
MIKVSAGTRIPIWQTIRDELYYSFHHTTDKQEDMTSHSALCVIVDQKDENMAKKTACKEFIYEHYSFEKQAQDEKWATAFLTKLKSSGMKDVEKTIVALTIAVLNGKSIDEVTEKIPTQAKPMIEKLIKIAIRTEWTERCVIACRESIVKNKPLKFPAPFWEIK